MANDSNQSTGTGGLDGIVEAAVNAQEDETRPESDSETDTAVEDASTESEGQQDSDDEMIEVRSNGYVENDPTLDDDATLVPDTESSSSRGGSPTPDATGSDEATEDEIIAPERTTPAHQTPSSSDTQSTKRQCSPNRAESIEVLDDAEFVGVESTDEQSAAPEADEFKTQLEDFEFQRERQSASEEEVPARGDAVFIDGADRHENATVDDDDPRETKSNNRTHETADEDDDDDSAFIVGS